MKEQVRAVGAQNVVQLITDNAPSCRVVGLLVENEFPHIFWMHCVVHTLNLALKAICATKDTEANEVTFSGCNWITEVSNDAFAMKHFITNHSLSNAIYNEDVELKMLSVAPTRFAYVVVMLKKMLKIKRGLTLVVVSEKWETFKDEDRVKTAFFKSKVLDDLWWEQIKYIVDFTEPIYHMLKITDTDKPCLRLIHDMWDTMIEKVKEAIYRHEGREDFEVSTFYNVVHTILEARWKKSNTPLHCWAHSLNPRYYTEDWLKGGVGRVAPHNDKEIIVKRNKCFRRYFPNGEDRRKVLIEFAKFSSMHEQFGDFDSINDRSEMDPSYL
ncbi:hypothetical protein M5689_010488 [Euphorbia peplus]|nr:hypothetical protein M5689_010488 [Euphorbia peplus]